MITFNVYFNYSLLYDEVKSSIELLDKVLSEFEDFDSIDAQVSMCKMFFL